MSGHDWKALPEVSHLLDEVAIERFWAKTEKQDNGCIFWIACKVKNGYGMFQLGGKMVRAHQIAWYLKHGLMPPMLVIDHTCKNKMCVNVEHLEAVTSSENKRRVGRKGICKRGHSLIGDNHFKKGRYSGCLLCIKIRTKVLKSATLGE